VRVREGGEVLDRIAFDRAAFACALGGDDGRTLFVMAAEWRADQDPVQNIQRLTTGPRTGRVLTTRAPAPHAGHP
jgi:sugar lactone lactonase YvrE